MVENITLVAEVGINANGSVDIAKKLVDVCVEAGVTHIKFQKRDVENGGCYTQAELDSPRDSPWGTTTRQQKLGLEFTLDQYKEIDLYCKSKGIPWFVSPWDLQSIDFMEQNFPDTPFYKVASAKLTDKKFLQALRAAKRPVILSTGMSTPEQVVEAMRILNGSDTRHTKDRTLYGVMHCTSTYPTKPEEMNLPGIAWLRGLVRDEFDEMPIRVGFSNHYSGLLWAPLAVAFGASMLEFHITLDRTMYGSDQAASIEPDGVKRLVEYVNVSCQMLQGVNGVRPEVIVPDAHKSVYGSELPIAKKLRKVCDF